MNDSQRKNDSNHICISYRHGFFSYTKVQRCPWKTRGEHSKHFSKNTFLCCCNKQITAVADGRKKKKKKKHALENGQESIHTIRLRKTLTTTSFSSSEMEKRTLHMEQNQATREEISWHCSLTAKADKEGRAMGERLV